MIDVAKIEELAARLRKLASGRLEYRVQDPVAKCYCISFNRDDSLDPERDARRWLEDFKREFPRNPHARYEVAAVRSFSELEQAALESADALDVARKMVAAIRAAQELIAYEHEGKPESPKDIGWPQWDAKYDALRAALAPFTETKESEHGN